MSAALPKLRVGEPLRHEALSVFPLFAETESDVEYRLADEALADESLLVEEVSEGGSVPDLLVENKGDERVLFLEGEELVGAKQNRVLNTSLLVAAHSKIKIPVSCVERGRWAYKSRQFKSSGSHSPHKLRHALKSSVSRAVREERGYRSDQGQVWEEVAHLNAACGALSETDAMSAAFDTQQDQISAYRESLPYIDGATGIAMAIGERVVSMDLFDKPSTCRKVWDRMLSGVVFDAIGAGPTEAQASVHDVEDLVEDAGEFPWQEADTVGEGQEFRAESPHGDHASTLSLEDTVVHGSVVAAS